MNSQRPGMNPATAILLLGMADGAAPEIGIDGCCCVATAVGADGAIAVTGSDDTAALASFFA